MATESENADISALPTSARRPFSVVLAIGYRNHSETQTVALPAILGRSQEANVRLRDPWISHIHCSLDEIGGTVVVRDLDSKNGIFVNGHRVKEAPLQPGDRFTLGVTEITMERRAAASEVIVKAAATPFQGDPASVPDTRVLPES